MRYHLIFDFSFLYYKYKFAIESGRMKRLTYPIEIGGVKIEKDVSQIYYAIREMEGIRKKLSSKGAEVTVSICFDSKSKRKEEETEVASEYKANRVSKLNSFDFDNIAFVKKLLDEAGYNTYKIDGIEADDIVHALVEHYSDKFDDTLIVTCDLDLAINIKPHVNMYRFKSTSGYGFIMDKNFSEVVGAELKCNMPYNAVMLYKCTVGDKSDNIKGINKFGPAAFNKMISYLSTNGYSDWDKLNTYDETKKVLDNLGGYLKPEQLSQAYESLGLVRPIELTCDEVAFPCNQSDRDKREAAYMQLGMQSLV